MWVENIQELKKRSGMTIKQIAEKSQIPEGTVKRILAGDNEPSAFNLFRIVNAMGGSLDEILGATNAIIAPPDIVVSKENAEAENDAINARNAMLEAKVNALTLETELLKTAAQLKDELIATHKQYIALIKAYLNME